MKTKNQHYVPMFYLKYFSFNSNNKEDDNCKEVAIFNTKNKLFAESRPIKGQCSDKYFYGKDGIIEEKLRNIETELSPIFREITNKVLPKKKSNDHFSMLILISLMITRNPVSIDGIYNMEIGLIQQLKELYGDDVLENMFPNEKINPQNKSKKNIEFSLDKTIDNAKILLDLEYKLLVNESNTPFITSDFPVVKYNQFMEKNKRPGGITGLMTVGLQVFFPISPKILLVLYDSRIYKYGPKKEKIIIVNEISEINQLNLMQFINCNSTILFNNNVTEEYILHLFMKSKKFEKANQHIVKECNFQGLSTKKNDVGFHLTFTDCKINLELNGLKIHSGGKKYKWNPTMAQNRPYTERIFTDLV